MTLTIVTSLNGRLWNTYAKNSIASWVRHLRGDYKLVITLDGGVPLGLTEVLRACPPYEIVLLDNVPEYRAFVNQFGHVNVTPPNVPPEHAFRFQFMRFAPKVFSLDYVSKRLGTLESALWLDADVQMFNDLDVGIILKDVWEHQQGNAPRCYSLVCLDRGQVWNYPDSGYMLYTNKDDPRNPWETLWNLYDTGSIFYYREIHDAFLLARVLESFGKDWYEENVLSLSGKVDTQDSAEYLNPMEKTWLSEFCVHFKGGRKGETVAR